MEGFMKDIGIRQLKAHASDLVRRVEEEHATYTITRHGRPVGVLAPANYRPPVQAKDGEAAWEQLEGIWDRADRNKRTRKSALRELAGMRR
jgi:prevent-host-death family protein